MNSLNTYRSPPRLDTSLPKSDSINTIIYNAKVIRSIGKAGTERGILKGEYNAYRNKNYQKLHILGDTDCVRDGAAVQNLRIYIEGIIEMDVDDNVEAVELVTVPLIPCMTITILRDKLRNYSTNNYLYRCSINNIINIVNDYESEILSPKCHGKLVKSPSLNI